MPEERGSKKSAILRARGSSMDCMALLHLAEPELLLWKMRKGLKGPGEGGVSMPK